MNLLTPRQVHLELSPSGYLYIWILPSPVIKTTHDKHLGLILDEKLNFKEHLKDKMSKAYQGMAALRKLQNIFPRNSLLTIYKSCIRPHLDYGNVIY